jgi:ornithine cyclodeaminase/alanine dehydrogenase-like protein (mu-crystallin family)
VNEPDGLLYLSHADVLAAAVQVAADADLLNPMGMAVIDVACAKAICYRARQAKIGTWLSR